MRFWRFGSLFCHFDFTPFCHFDQSEAESRARGEISERSDGQKGIDRAIQSDFSTALEMTVLFLSTELRAPLFVISTNVEKSRSVSDGQKGATELYSQISRLRSK